MIKQAGLSTVQHPRVTAEQSFVTNEIMIPMNSDQQLHPVSKIIKRQGSSYYDSHVIVTWSISSHI